MNREPESDVVKEMYTCGRKSKEVNAISNVIGMIVIISLLAFVAYRLFQRPDSISLDKLIAFVTEQDVHKLFVSLLMLTHIKTLTTSLTTNIVSPMIKPILPLLTCNLKLKLGLFELLLGDFISDIIVFAVNLSIIYIIFAMIY
jgi:hypothetical protein